jgi:ribosomal protein S18 acetylase RimI-like enzyme
VTGGHPPAITLSVRFAAAKASRAEIADHLRRCDSRFAPPLSSRVDIDEYAGKLHERSATLEAWDATRLVGLVAVYLNDPLGADGFVSNVSVEAELRGQGVARELMTACIDAARQRGFARLRLEVQADNESAIALYEGLGFTVDGERGSSIQMTKTLRG